MGECSKIRGQVMPFIKEGWIGLDVGCGNDPINETCITLDCTDNYTSPKIPINIIGDARSLDMFSDNSLDYIFSSHVLEDFENPEEVISEWLRVIKQGGLLILYLPDEQKYRKLADFLAFEPNPYHRNSEMSLKYMLELIKKFPVEIEYSYEEPEDHMFYGFLLIVRKL